MRRSRSSLSIPILGNQRGFASRNSFLTTAVFLVPCRTQDHDFPSLTLPPSSFFIQIGCISSKLSSKPKSRKHSVDIICSFARIIVSTSRVVHLHREGADEYYCCWEAIMSTLGDNANLWASLFLGGYFKLLPSTRFVSSPDVISTTIFTIFTTTIFSGRCLEVTELSRPQRSLPQYRWHQDCARCPTVTIIVRWWCVFLRISLELVRWSNAAYLIILSSKDTMTFLSRQCSYAACYCEENVWKLCHHLKQNSAQVISTMRNQRNEVISAIIARLCTLHFPRGFPTLPLKFEISSLQMESNYLFVNSFSPRSQCEFLQLAIALRF